MKFKYLLCFCLIFISKLTVSKDNYVLKVFSNTELKQEFGKFIENVLRQVDLNKFNNLVDNIIKTKNPQTDIDFYKELISKIDTIKPYLLKVYQFNALKNQKKVLGEQIRQLLGNPTSKRPIKLNGVVEIGSPGTYLSSLNFAKISGKFYAIMDKEGFSHRIQAGHYGILPYTNFIPLNNYATITETQIPSNSVDLVICLIGLHHVPKDKLEAFVKSIHRILRPGGTFILRDHDASSEDVLAIADAAHSVFNAIVDNSTIQEEQNEYRNFQPLSYWVDLVEKNGFKAGQQTLLQNGDPTLNTMIKFTKVALSDSDKKMQALVEARAIKGYERDLIQTYLTSPEWHNVDVSQEYGNFIEHTPFYEYPYFKSIASSWDVFKKSWSLAAKKSSHLKVLMSPYTLMNLFVGITNTIEYTAKGLISLPVRWMYSGAAKEPEFVMALIKDIDNNLENVGLNVEVVNVYDNGLKIVKIPRYKVFLNAIQQMISKNIKFVEIAGQKEIQVKIQQPANKPQDPCFGFDGCKKEYSWNIPTQPGSIFSVINVDVDRLDAVIKMLNDLKYVNILYIHDF